MITLFQKSSCKPQNLNYFSPNEVSLQKKKKAVLVQTHDRTRYLSDVPRQQHDKCLGPKINQRLYDCKTLITHVNEENRHSLQAQLVPECCSMRNLDRNQPAAGSNSISEKYQGAENAFSAVRLLRSRDQ